MKIFSLATALVASVANASYCEDTAHGFADSYGDSCDWYANNPICDGTWDTTDFTASHACCGCGGGVNYSCSDTNNGVGDVAGDQCDWYEEYGYCGTYDTWEFWANSMCCTCGGGADICSDSNNGVGDSWGDGCDWYESNPGYCGSFDWEGFTASAMCCTCQDQVAQQNLATYECNEYLWTTDVGYDGCDWYWWNSEQCGWWDDNDFSAWGCCACGGGTYTCSDTWGVTDSWGDGCDWYEGNEAYCGSFDH